LATDPRTAKVIRAIKVNIVVFSICRLSPLQALSSYIISGILRSMVVNALVELRENIAILGLGMGAGRRQYWRCVASNECSGVRITGQQVSAIVMCVASPRLGRKWSHTNLKMKMASHREAALTDNTNHTGRCDAVTNLNVNR